MVFKKKVKGIIHRTIFGILNCPNIGEVAYLSSYTFWPCISNAKFIYHISALTNTEISWERLRAGGEGDDRG